MMDDAMLKDRLQRVANTLAATKMRVDAIEATERVRACLKEVLDIVEEMNEEGEAENE